MAAAFRPVNSPLANPVSREDVMASSPATPRPNTAPHTHPSRPIDDGATPTRATFNVSMASQKPLPSSPFPQSVQVPDSAPKPRMPRRHNSRHSNKSADSGDVEMDDSDGETGTIEEGQASDEESVGAEGTRSSKKKKSQRFYCTDYPPCNLSFTRSEHLARHIRCVNSYFASESHAYRNQQETYRRTALSVSLLATFFAAGQLEATCADCSCQREYSHGFAGSYRFSVPASDATGSCTAGWK